MARGLEVKKVNNMEKITISGEITVQFRDTTCIIEETGAGLVALTPSEAIHLATALYARYAEWKPVTPDVYMFVPYLLKDDSENCHIGYMGYDGYFIVGEQEKRNITHYTEILKPSI